MAGKPRGFKTGGRKAGTLNKKTQSLLAKCEESGIDPFGILLKHCTDLDKTISMAAAKEVCQYILPKRRSLEHSGNIDPKMMDAAEEVMTMTKDEQIELLEKELKKLKYDETLP